MSMILNLTALNEIDYNALVRGMRDVESFIYPDDGNYDDVGEKSIDLDKSWHAIHYMLTGDAWGGTSPACDVLFGGQEHGPDVGYGPAKFMPATQVSEVAQYLSSLPSDFIESNFDPARFAANEIYPTFWDDIAGEEAVIIEYIQSNFDSLKDFYQFAKSQNLGVAIYMN